jgi:two-component system, chemotaxis family, response regulator Rcp1
MPGSGRLRVLIVDDSRSDLRLMADSLMEADASLDISTAMSGEEALERIRGATSAERPHVILLDINMPRVSGHEVLARIKQDADLRSVVVLMFSSSKAEADVRKAYEAYANGFIQKPIDLDRYAEIATTIASFWGHHNTQPGGGGS